MSLFRNKYRIQSSRLPRWDYSSPGWYFVTICTRDRKPFLSDIIDDAIVLKPAGVIATEEWLATPEIRPNIAPDEFIIMPNHIHGIIHILPPPIVQTPRCGVSQDETNDSFSNGDENETPQRGVSTKRSAQNWKPGVLGAIIGQYKNVAKKRIRKTVPEFDWQPRFHDHIIRNDHELFVIRRYIRNNPSNWAHDRNVIETHDRNSVQEPWSVYLP